MIYKFYASIFFCLLIYVPKGNGQSICQGSLGTNIFIEGDFGAGTSTILSMDPDIAPGYNYTQQMPPNDGFYTITNNSGNWPAIYDSWVRTEDASTDPNGYFMVVNASFDPGIFYEQEITGLCENTMYEFSADMINMIRRNVSNHILPNVAFFLNGVEQFNTGDIPQNEQWITFGFSFTTESDMTSLNLTLRNNAPGGIGNDLGLDNIRFKACGPMAFINPAERTELCKNDPVIDLNAVIEEEQAIFDQLQWQISTDMGINWDNISGANTMDLTHSEGLVGTYLYRYLLATSPENLANSKCWIQSDIAEIVILPEEFSVADTICEGTQLEIDGQVLTEAGDYVFNLVSQEGCDSNVYLQLDLVGDILEDTENFITDPNCFGEATGSIKLLDYVDSRLPYTTKMNGIEIEIIRDGPEFHSSIIENLPSGLYEFDIVDKYGCQTFLNIQLVDPPVFTIDVGPDLNLSLGETVLIRTSMSTSPSQISWSPGLGLSCTDCPDPELLAITNQEYILAAINNDGCETRDSFQLLVDDRKFVYIPNAFSPNGDGINDHFRFFSVGRSVLSIKEWLVYDRWGTPVFNGSEQSPSGQNLGWDGRLNNRKLDPDVYVYHLILEFLDGKTESFRGSITLLK